MASIIPVREHSEYALLWDLAREMVKLDDRTAEECWLAIMDAFWVGKLRELFVFGPRKGGERGRVLLQLPARSDIAHLLLGPGRDCQLHCAAGSMRTIWGSPSRSGAISLAILGLGWRYGVPTSSGGTARRRRSRNRNWHRNCQPAASDDPARSQASSDVLKQPTVRYSLNSSKSWRSNICPGLKRHACSLTPAKSSGKAHQKAAQKDWPGCMDVKARAE
jgi:hypothetical protein